MLALCLVGVTSGQEVKKKVAVYITGDVQAAYKKVIGSKMVSAITQSENYIAVERTADFLAELSKEQDYQMSGAVSDNQIAKLGQQFGVRYVVVADVSELFDEIFISARLINVQTGQIDASIEASKAVESMTQLLTVSEEVANGLFDYIDIANWNIQAIGPFSTLVELSKYKNSIPTGYRIITESELTKIIKLGQKISYPIYVDLSTPSSGNSGIYVKAKIYQSPTEHSNISDYYTTSGYNMSATIQSGLIYIRKE